MIGHEPVHPPLEPGELDTIRRAVSKGATEAEAYIGGMGAVYVVQRLLDDLHRATTAVAEYKALAFSTDVVDHERRTWTRTLTAEARAAAHAELHEQVKVRLSYGAEYLERNDDGTYDIETNPLDLDKILDAAMGTS